MKTKIAPSSIFWPIAFVGLLIWRLNENDIRMVIALSVSCAAFVFLYVFQFVRDKRATKNATGKSDRRDSRWSVFKWLSNWTLTFLWPLVFVLAYPIVLFAFGYFNHALSWYALAIAVLLASIYVILAQRISERHIGTLSQIASLVALGLLVVFVFGDEFLGFEATGVSGLSALLFMGLIELPTSHKYVNESWGGYKRLFRLYRINLRFIMGDQSEILARNIYASLPKGDDAANDPDNAERLFLDAIEQFPRKTEFLYRFAFFLRDIRNDYDRAEEYFARVIEQDPNDSDALADYANFLWGIREDYDRADEHYTRAIKLDPQNATKLGIYARFLRDVKNDYERAEDFYQEALKYDPENIFCLRDYALFLMDNREDSDRAESFFKKVIELEPGNAINLYSYAYFLNNTRKDYDKAEEFYTKAIELEPGNPFLLGGYAHFLVNIRKDYDQAEDIYNQAINLEPGNADNLGSYADFLLTIRKDYNKAGEYYDRAIDLEPKDAGTLGNYAKFLIVRGNLNKAKQLIQQAFKYNQDPEDPELELELWFYCYAVFYEEFPDSDTAIEALLEQGVTSTGWYLLDVLESAKKLGHPDFTKLSQYENRIVGPAK